MVNEEETVKQAFFSFIKAYNEGDVEQTLVAFSKNNLVVIGTAKHELCIGIDEFTHLMNNIADSLKTSHSQTKISYKEIQKNFVFEQVQIRNKIAWITVLVPLQRNTNVMSTFNEEIRITMVLEKIDQEWKIVQNHVSLPDARIHFGESTPSQSGIKTTIEAWLKEFDENLNLSEELKMSKLKEYLQKAQEIMAQSI